LAHEQSFFDPERVAAVTSPGMMLTNILIRVHPETPDDF
jgi:hypothetical protein